MITEVTAVLINKTGEKNGKKWTQYKVQTTDGQTIYGFNRVDLGDSIEVSQKDGTEYLQYAKVDPKMASPEVNHGVAPATAPAVAQSHPDTQVTGDTQQQILAELVSIRKILENILVSGSM